MISSNNRSYEETTQQMMTSMKRKIILSIGILFFVKVCVGQIVYQPFIPESEEQQPLPSLFDELEENIPQIIPNRTQNEEGYRVTVDIPMHLLHKKDVFVFNATTYGASLKVAENVGVGQATYYVGAYINKRVIPKIHLRFREDTNEERFRNVYDSNYYTLHLLGSDNKLYHLTMMTVKSAKTPPLVNFYGFLPDSGWSGTNLLSPLVMSAGSTIHCYLENNKLTIYIGGREMEIGHIKGVIAITYGIPAGMSKGLKFDSDIYLLDDDFEFLKQIPIHQLTAPTYERKQIEPTYLFGRGTLTIEGNMSFLTENIMALLRENFPHIAKCLDAGWDIEIVDIQGGYTPDTTNCTYRISEHYTNSLKGRELRALKAELRQLSHFLSVRMDLDYCFADNESMRILKKK